MSKRSRIAISVGPSERVALRPLHSFWIDLLILRLLSKPEAGQKKVWFVIDELASLQRLPQLHTAITFGDGCILANAATLAGHVTVEDFATVGALCPVHQHCTIGRYAYVGGGTTTVAQCNSISSRAVLTHPIVMASACVIGSGPNGLSAGIVLAQAGLVTTVFERNARIGGGCSTAELTLPGFRHDVGSSIFAMGYASPFFRSLHLDVPWIEPQACCAHPLDNGTAVLLEHSVEATAEGLDARDREAYRALLGPIVADFPKLIGELLGPVVHWPRALFALARFGLPALLPAATLARWRFKGPRARALFAGMAAHSVQPLEKPTSAAVGLVLMAVGHASGWPIARGGAQTLTDALAGMFRSLGGEIRTGHEVTELEPELGPEHVTLADVTPRQMLRIAGTKLPKGYRKQLEAFQYGAGSFKVDYALSEPIPWTAAACARAGTVHLGGTLEEIAFSERALSVDRPFVLVVQPSLFDPARAPDGKHTAWAYCHVPNGSTADYLGAIERQIERFAPGFGECVLARAISPPAQLEAWNPNLVGGDLSAGAMSPKQLVFRPTPSLYRTPVKGLYFCGASTPPGGGVHGMAGFHAARAALRDLALA